ncbi:hypothetical protein [Aliivibrio fischeri]|uniref:hypothetical protein n=1 Tax=Aliivibrio fischeri TaxID=668 RepID=UPI0012DA8BB8|nr:hypothetical protein [Aliivibrio fischeri]MUK71465.1 hypothetical protein [Aliivibrio fischeri]MUK75233.1 hypothetical protein [Aliivibrio fischeri]
MEQQKIRYLVTQCCENNEHNGALGVVSETSNSPREDEQNLISKVEQCEKCHFHSIFFCDENVVEIKRKELTGKEKIYEQIVKSMYVFVLVGLLAISLLLSYIFPSILKSSEFSAFAAFSSLGLIAIASLLDPNTISQAKWANVVAFVFSFWGFLSLL